MPFKMSDTVAGVNLKHDSTGGPIKSLNCLLCVEERIN